MKNLTAILFLLCFTNFGFSQECLPNGISLNTQEDVDNFAINYPDCTHIIGDLIIDGSIGISNINNLSALSNIISVGGSLHISQCDLLPSLNALYNLNEVGAHFECENNDLFTDLSGLENLNTVGESITLQNNTALISLSGLENLSSVGSYFNIQYNAALLSLNGLENLNSIGFFLNIETNNSLYDLSGLESLSSIGSIYINENNAMASLNGLENLSTINGEIRLYENPILSLCHVPFICNFYDLINPTFLYGNAPSCNSIFDISNACLNSSDHLYHPIYYDINANGIFDNSEPYLPQTSVLISPNDIISYGNPYNGGYHFLENGTYNIQYNSTYSPNWQVNSGASNYTITLDQNSPSDTVYFGLIPTDSITKINTYVVSGSMRCNDMVLFNTTVYNDGTLPASGTLWLQVDVNTTDAEYLDIPDTIVAPYLYGWHYNNLFPGHSLTKKIRLGIPGPPDFPIGESVTFSSFSNYIDFNGINETDKFIYTQTVQCSFDPNDKLVQSTNPYSYALLDQDLIYTIRFQNTGNAEAYNVVITDELNSNLDLSTFQYISSSHESVLSTYLEGNSLTFEFRDIFLPDSTTNFEASQGYVMYSIRAVDTLADFSSITNTANIFFDSNPAVITNTTENIMVESFDSDADGFDLWEDCDDNNPLVNIGEEEPYNGIDDDCDEMTLDDDLDQDGFLLVNDCDDANPLINSTATEIPNNGIDEDCDGQDLITIGTKDIVSTSPQLFPNPTTGMVKVVLPVLEKAELELVDYTGRQLLKMDFEKEAAFDIVDLPKGVYILLIKTGQHYWTERVVKI